MKHVKILLLFVVIIGVQAKSITWKKPKPLKSYTASAYTLKTGVAYFEIREYVWDSTHEVNKNNYKVIVSSGKTPLKSFDKKIQKRFKSIAPNFSKKANIRKISGCLMSGCVFRQSNGFMIDDQQKIWRMNEVSDVVKYLGTIDTPAELKLLLWLNNEAHDEDKYQRTAKGYTVISEYDNSIDNFGECGHFVYRLKINKKGKITEKKLLKKTKSKNGCITAD